MKTVKMKPLGLIMICGVLLSGLMATQVQAFEVLVEGTIVKKIIPEEEIVRTADNFVVLVDGSGSMMRSYEGTNKKRIEVAKEILQERNALLPNLGYNAGLYLFGPENPYYRMARYDRDEFSRAIEKLPTSLRTPPPRWQMVAALDSLLSTLSGRTAVMIFTDGESIPPARGSPGDAAEKLAAKHNVCFYVVSAAQTQRQKRNVQALASANACSRVIPFDRLYGRPEYVDGALFTIEDIVIVKRGVFMKVVGVRTENILFDINSSTIHPEFYEELNALGGFMQKNPQTYVVVAGFTDSIGSEEYNLVVSRRRAENVANYLTTNFGIAEERIATLWYGKADPAASNATTAGRAQNRRVVTSVGGF